MMKHTGGVCFINNNFIRNIEKKNGVLFKYNLQNNNILFNKLFQQNILLINITFKNMPGEVS